MGKGAGLTAVLLAAVLVLGGCGAAEEEQAKGPAPEAPALPVFSIDCLSTGKSDCALIRMDGLTILSDTAETDDFDRICSLLDQYGIQKIDYIVISHYDKDHIGSAAGLILNYEVGAVVGPDRHEGSDEYSALRQAVRARDTEWITLTEDFTLSTANGTLTVDPPDEDYGDDNNDSLLTTVTWNGENFLFLGDAKKLRMEEFEDVALGSYRMVKLPHHGDSCKPLLRLIRRTSPLWAVEMLSAFESVEEPLLEALQETNTELYLTRDGDIRILWEDGAFTISQFSAG